MHADDSPAQEEGLHPRARRGRSAEQPAFHVADAEPRHAPVAGVEGGGAVHRATGSDQTPVTVPEELNDRPVRSTLERPYRHLGGAGGFGAMAQTVDDRDEPAFTRREDHGAVAGLALTRLDQVGDGPLERGTDQRLHRRIVTVVPLPKPDVTST